MPHRTGRQLLLALASALFTATFAVGIYGLLHHPRTAGEPAASADPARSEGPSRSQPQQVSGPAPALAHTDDPVGYARSVATSLFDWDTASGYGPADYSSAVLRDADPSGEETPGLVADVATYLPTNAQWLNLATMEVSQRIAITGASVPGTWAAVLGQSRGTLRPGTTAVTIDGVRQRRGIWNGDAAASSHPVSFTVFLACRPSFDRCHVLRLSRLDAPLR